MRPLTLAVSGLSSAPWGAGRLGRPAPFASL